jgi:hypothetical protein
MENIITEFKADNLVMRLTVNNLFINTATFNETLALSSILGISVIDLVEDYHQPLSMWNKNREGPLYIFGVLFAIWGLYSFSLFMDYAIFILVVSAIVFIWAYVRKKNNVLKSPKSMFAIKIIFNNGNREYKFDKTGIKISKIVDFLADVKCNLLASQQKKR